MSFRVEPVRDYRVNGVLSDDSTISTFHCDDTACDSKRLAEHDETIPPEGWYPLFHGDETYHACSMECRLRVLSWLSATGESGRSSD